MNLYVIINFRGLNVNTYGLLFQGRTGFFTGPEKFSERHPLSETEPKAVVEIVDKGGIEFVKFDFKP